LSWAVARGQVGRPVETVHPGGHSKVKSPVHPMLEDPRSSLSSRHWRSRWARSTCGKPAIFGSTDRPSSRTWWW